MTQQNIFAFTALDGSYPEYISINETDGKVMVSVRGPAIGATDEKQHLSEGSFAKMELPIEHVGGLAEALHRYYREQIAAGRLCLELAKAEVEFNRQQTGRKGGPTVSDPDRPYCKPDQSCCDFTCGN